MTYWVTSYNLICQGKLEPPGKLLFPPAAGWGKKLRAKERLRDFESWFWLHRPTWSVQWRSTKYTLTQTQTRVESIGSKKVVFYLAVRMTSQPYTWCIIYQLHHNKVSELKQNGSLALSGSVRANKNSFDEHGLRNKVWRTKLDE